MHAVHVPLKSPVGKSRTSRGPGQKRWNMKRPPSGVPAATWPRIPHSREEERRSLGREALGRRLECGEACRKGEQRERAESRKYTKERAESQLTQSFLQADAQFWKDVLIPRVGRKVFLKLNPSLPVVLMNLDLHSLASGVWQKPRIPGGKVVKDDCQGCLELEWCLRFLSQKWLWGLGCIWVVKGFHSMCKLLTSIPSTVWGGAVNILDHADLVDGWLWNFTPCPQHLAGVLESSRVFAFLASSQVLWSVLWTIYSVSSTHTIRVGLFSQIRQLTQAVDSETSRCFCCCSVWKFSWQHLRHNENTSVYTFLLSGTNKRTRFQNKFSSYQQLRSSKVPTHLWDFRGSIQHDCLPSKTCAYRTIWLTPILKTRIAFFIITTGSFEIVLCGSQCWSWHDPQGEMWKDGRCLVGWALHSAGSSPVIIS